MLKSGFINNLIALGASMIILQKSRLVLKAE